MTEEGGPITRLDRCSTKILRLELICCSKTEKNCRYRRVSPPARCDTSNLAVPSPTLYTHNTTAHDVDLPHDSPREHESGYNGRRTAREHVQSIQHVGPKQGGLRRTAKTRGKVGRIGSGWESLGPAPCPDGVIFPVAATSQGGPRNLG